MNYSPIVGLIFRHCCLRFVTFSSFETLSERVKQGYYSAAANTRCLKVLTGVKESHAQSNFFIRKLL